MFAFGHPLDAFANPTYPGTVFYSPDGEHWSSRALPELFSLDSLALTFAAAPTAAVVVARRAVAHPASETELFLVTRRPPTP